MYKVGDVIKWRAPYEPMCSYGIVQEIKRGVVVVSELGYYQGRITGVSSRYVRQLKKKGGGKVGGRSKKCNK